MLEEKSLRMVGKASRKSRLMKARTKPPEPSQMRVCGHTVQVRTEDPGAWSSNGIGRSHSGRAEILLKSGLPEEVRQSTLLHETIHMIADMNSLKGITDEETTVAVLANALFAWMRDNKAVVAGIAGM